MTDLVNQMKTIYYLLHFNRVLARVISKSIFCIEQSTLQGWLRTLIILPVIVFFIKLQSVDYNVFNIILTSQIQCAGAPL